MNTITSDATEKDRKSAFRAHIGALIFAALSSWLASNFLTFRVAGIGGAIFALAFWLMHMNGSAFIRAHAAKAFNFNASMFLYSVALIIFWELTDGVLFLIIAPVIALLIVLWISCPIVAAKEGRNGEDCRYPMTIRFLK
jgi:uncharacterized Tic20 family protein